LRHIATTSRKRRRRRRQRNFLLLYLRALIEGEGEDDKEEGTMLFVEGEAKTTALLFIPQRI